MPLPLPMNISTRLAFVRFREVTLVTESESMKTSVNCFGSKHSSSLASKKRSAEEPLNSVKITIVDSTTNAKDLSYTNKLGDFELHIHENNIYYLIIEKRDYFTKTVVLNIGDSVPKIIDNCEMSAGDDVTIKFGKDLAWATIVTP